MQSIKERVSKNEILRYLGHSNQFVEESLYNLIDNCVDRIADIARYRYTYKVFDIKAGTYEDKPCIEVDGSRVKFIGNDIFEHLKNCEKCAVMAATLGIEVDNAIRNAQRGEMLRALVLDACAAEFIEKLCDKAQDEIRAEAAREGYALNFRFSPGYGDFPIEMQREVAALIDTARRTGITVTDNSIMIPNKSVTAIIGFTKDTNLKQKKTKCDICSMRHNCMFKRGGITCERGRVYKA